MTVEPEACSDEQNNEAVLNSSCEREMEELLPNAAQNPKRRKKAQPRKLQIEKDDSGDSGKGGEVVTLVETGPETGLPAKQVHACLTTQKTGRIFSRCAILAALPLPEKRGRIFEPSFLILFATDWRSISLIYIL